MIEDLKDEINLLSHALQNNDKNYEFQIHVFMYADLEVPTKVIGIGWYCERT